MIAILVGLLVVFVCVYVLHSQARLERARDRAWEKREAEWAGERAQMLDRIMYLANHPWEMPDQPQQEEYVSYEEEPDALQTPIDTDYIYFPAGTV